MFLLFRCSFHIFAESVKKFEVDNIVSLFVFTQENIGSTEAENKRNNFKFNSWLSWSLRKAVFK